MAHTTPAVLKGSRGGAVPSAMWKVFGDQLVGDQLDLSLAVSTFGDTSPLALPELIVNVLDVQSVGRLSAGCRSLRWRVQVATAWGAVNRVSWQRARMAHAIVMYLDYAEMYRFLCASSSCNRVIQDLYDTASYRDEHDADPVQASGGEIAPGPEVVEAQTGVP